MVKGQQIQDTIYHVSLSYSFKYDDNDDYDKKLNSFTFIEMRHAMTMLELVNAFYLPRGEPLRGDPGCERTRSSTFPTSNSKSSTGTVS
jgi:hypothetical protein